MATKNSFGNGYGINRNLKGSSHLTTAIPPHARVTRNSPGSPPAKATGKSGKKHFSGAKFG
jgi:hypothetical protein